MERFSEWIQITFPFLILFLLPKLQKNLHYLISKHLPASFSPVYLSVNLFDGILLVGFLYFALRKINPLSLLRDHMAGFFLLLFLVWTRISLRLVDPIYLSTAHVLFFTFFAGCLCFYLGRFNSLQKKVEKHFGALLFLFVIFSSLQCAIGLGQFAIQKRLDLFFIKEWHTLDAFISIGVPFSELLIGKLVSFTGTSTEILRTYGTMSHPNIFGGFLSLACFAFYFLFLRASTLSQRVLISLLLSAHILALFTTFSRSGTISFLMLTSLFVVYHFKSKVRKSLYSLLAVICLSCVASFALLGPLASERMASLPVSAEKIAANSYRIMSFQLAQKMILANPVSGIGYRQFVNKMDSYIRGENAIVEKLPTHNIYLLLGAETGLVGLFLFCAFLFFVLKGAFSQLGKSSAHFFFFGVSLGSLVVGLVDCYPMTCFFWRMAFFSSLGFSLVRDRSFGREGYRDTLGTALGYVKRGQPVHLGD